MRRVDVVTLTASESADADRFFDLRRIEILRQVVIREIRVHGGLRGIARSMRIDRGSLRKFVEGQSTPQPETLRLIADWAGNRPEATIPLGLVGLAVLLADVRPVDRPRARRRIAAVLAGIYQASGEGSPTWIVDEMGGEAVSAEAHDITSGDASPEERSVLAEIRRLLNTIEP